VTARRALLVDAGEALRHPGSRRPLRRDVVLDDLGLSSAQVPEGGVIVLDLELEAVGADVVVSGTVLAPWEGACRRCLEPVTGTLELDVREIFERRPTEGQTYPIEDEDRLDLEPLLREAVLLSLPLSPLCSETCAGPDPDRFPAAVEDAGPDEGAEGDEAAAPAEPPRDPRWAALDQLRPDPS
jgi:uncharacterized protein